MGLKRWIAAATAAAIALTSGCFSVILGTTAAAAEEEEAESKKIVYISTAEELKAFRDDVNSGNQYAGITVKLMNDIDLKGEQWEPIAHMQLFSNGGTRYYFSGVFDGGGHEVSGLYINIEDNVSVPSGLFGHVSGTIKNLGVSGSITVRGREQGFVGGIAGLLNGGTVYNCYNKCTLSGGCEIGGIVGYSYPSSSNCGVIANCYNEGDIDDRGNDTTRPSDYVFMGGILGSGNAMVENCYNVGSITAYREYGIPNVTSQLHINGVSGKNCYNTGTLTYNGDPLIFGNGSNNNYNSVSGAVGTSSYYLKDCLVVAKEENLSSSGGATAITEADLKKQSTFEGWDFTNVWKMSENGPVLQMRTDTHTHNDDDGDGEAEEFSIWTSTSTLPNAGNWYLAGDITLENYENLRGVRVLNLCLNGHTIKASYDRYKLSDRLLFGGGQFNIYDCSPKKSGTITDDGTAEYSETLAFIKNQCTLRLYGGNIVTQQGRAIMNSSSGSVSVYDGKISGTTYGIYSESDATNAVNLSGSPEITGGKADIYMYSYEKVVLGYINIIGPLTGGPYKLELSYPYAFVFTNSENTKLNDPSKFIPTNDGYTIYKNNDGQLFYVLSELTVKFDYQDVLGDIPMRDKTVHYNEPYGELPNPVNNPGYIFYGWYTESYGGTRVTEETYVTATNNHTLYARWGKEGEPAPPEIITVTFDYQGADGGSDTLSKTVEVGGKYGELPRPTKSDHIFRGWYTDKEDGILVDADSDVIGDANHILYARWEECDHSEKALDKAVSATCTENGLTEGEHCALCGKVFKAQETIPATDHDWEDGWTIADFPDLTEEGTAKRICRNDNSHEEYKTVPVLTDKTVWELVENYEPTCRIDGGQRYYSPEYGNVDVILPKLGHQWDSGTIIIQPTHSTEGRITYRCSVCGETRTDVLPALGSSGGGTSSPSTTTAADYVPFPPSTTAPSTTTAPTTTAPTTTAPTTTAPTTTAPTTTAPTTTAPTSSPSVTTAAGADLSADAAPDVSSSIVSADSGANAPNVSINGASAKQLEAEVMANHLTPAEIAAIENGAELAVIISADNAEATVPAAERASVETAAAASGYAVGQYLNIDILKYIGGQQTGRITQLSDPISITVDVPENLRSSYRSFAILRVHDGETELLRDTDSNPDTITISTDKFSTYAIVYQDTADVQVPSEVGGTQAPSSPANPNTGVRPVTELAVLSFAFGGTAVLLVVTGKKKADSKK